MIDACHALTVAASYIPNIMLAVVIVCLGLLAVSAGRR